MALVIKAEAIYSIVSIRWNPLESKTVGNSAESDLSKWLLSNSGNIFSCRRNWILSIAVAGILDNLRALLKVEFSEQLNFHLSQR